ncbi:hypothetical protein AEGHOMDF_2911 [Methylobacterium soli]|nr:hypothetical protein AEGHOMDF_2911 [Methylobacterium soli]
MHDARSLLSRRDVPSGTDEEVHCRVVGKGGRIGDVDDDAGALQRIREPLARDGVHPRIRRGPEHLVAGVPQVGDDLGAY